MKCDCLQKVKENIMKLEKVKGAPANILRVEIDNVSFNFEKKGVNTRTSQTISLKIEGRKRDVKIDMLHTFCPFCGVKEFEEEKGDEDAKN